MCAGGPVVPWSRGPVWLPAGPVPRPQPGLGWVSQDPESVARWTRSVGAAWSRGPVVPSGPVAPSQRGAEPLFPGSRFGCPVAPFGGGRAVPWSRGPVWPRVSASAWLRIIAAPIQNRWLAGPVRWAPVVPWSRGPVWPRGSASAWLRIIARRIQNRWPGGPVRRGPVVPWPRGPVVPFGLSFSSSLSFAVWGPRSGIVKAFLQPFADHK